MPLRPFYSRNANGGASCSYWHIGVQNRFPQATLLQDLAANDCGIHENFQSKQSNGNRAAMAGPKDDENPPDASVTEWMGKRTRKPSAEGLDFQRRRLLSSSNDTESGEQTTYSAQHATRSGDGSDALPGADKQATGNLAALDESLMALLLPDSFPSRHESIGAPPERQSTFSSAAETGGPCSVERSVPVRSDEVSPDLLPVPAGVAGTGSPQVRVQNVIASGCVVVEGRRSASLDLRRIAVSCRLAEYNPRKINACIVRLRKPKCTGLIFRSGRVMVTGAQSEDAAFRAARLLVRMLQAVLGPPSPAVAGSHERAALTSEPARHSDDGPVSMVDVVGSHMPTSTPLTGATDAGTLSDYPSEGQEQEQRPTKNAAAPGSAESVVLTRARGESPVAGAFKGGFSSIRLTQFAVENIVATADCGLPVRLEGLAFDHKEFCSYEPELFAGLVYRYSPTPSLKAVLLIFVSGKVVITGCKSAAEIQEVFHSFFPVLLKYHT